MTNPLGFVTTYSYDTGSNLPTTLALLSVAYPDGTHDFFAYDARVRLIRSARSAMIYPIIVLTVAAGVVALMTVFVLPTLADWVASAHLPARVHVPSIFLSLAVSITVGVGFGWYPARRASLLDPIEALRHE